MFSVEARQRLGRDRNLAGGRFQRVELRAHRRATYLKRGQLPRTRLTCGQMGGYLGSFGGVQRAVEIGAQQARITLHFPLQAASNAASARASMVPTEPGAMPSASAISR